MRTRSWEGCLPTERVEFLSVEEVLEIHRLSRERFGGGGGPRDPGLLESALYRPQTGYYPDLAAMAAALFESLLINHPFLDGNKRVAFFAADVFLRLNGYRIAVEAQTAHEFLVGLLARGEADYERLLGWLREHVVKTPGS